MGDVSFFCVVREHPVSCILDPLELRYVLLGCQSAVHYSSQAEMLPGHAQASQQPQRTRRTRFKLMLRRWENNTHDVADVCFK